MKLAITTPLTTKQTPRLLAWDTEFWGQRIAQTDHPDVDAWALANTVGCVCLLSDPDDPETIRDAEERGFRFTDVRAELAMDPAPLWYGAAREIAPPDLEPLAVLARRAHRITRFYADPRFDRDRCDDLYEGWLRNSVAGWAQAVLVLGPVGDPLGYVTVHLDAGSASIGLIAVREDERGHGYGLALTRAAVSWAHAQGAERMTVVTQGRNLAALATFQRAGFELRSTRLWLHRWSEEA